MESLFTGMVATRFVVSFFCVAGLGVTGAVLALSINLCSMLSSCENPWKKNNVRNIVKIGLNENNVWQKYLYNFIPPSFIRIDFGLRAVYPIASPVVSLTYALLLYEQLIQHPREFLGTVRIIMNKSKSQEVCLKIAKSVLI